MNKQKSKLFGSLGCNSSIRVALFVLLLLGFGESAGAWTHNMDFESGLTGVGGFTSVGTTVYWDSSETQSGNYSARINFVEGSDCWGALPLSCGATYITSMDVLCGDDLWTRAYYYFPSGWDWSDQAGGSSPYRKILRFGLLTPTDEYAGGYVSIIAHWNEPNDGEILGNTEPGEYGYANQFTGVDFPIGEWFCLEQYVLFGTTDETARHIIWLNETKVFDSNDLSSGDRKTMLDAADHCETIHFFTAWNGFVRTTQDAYIDNVIVTTDTPINTDADGFPMIGQDEGGDLTFPSRSNPQPTGTLASGTTSTTISLDTDETAICKYSIATNTDYDNMTLQLSSGQANSHTATVTDLEDGNSYTYYIKCQDESNNQNPDDFEISFSIASPSTTYSISNFINMFSDWLQSGESLESDVNGDGVVNTRDLGIMMSNWQN